MAFKMKGTGAGTGTGSGPSPNKIAAVLNPIGAVWTTYELAKWGGKQARKGLDHFGVTEKGKNYWTGKGGSSSKSKPKTDYSKARENMKKEVEETMKGNKKYRENILLQKELNSKSLLEKPYEWNRHSDPSKSNEKPTFSGPFFPQKNDNKKNDNKKNDNKEKIPALGTEARKKYYDSKKWKYDDTIKGYNRDGTKKEVEEKKEIKEKVNKGTMKEGTLKEKKNTSDPFGGSGEPKEKKDKKKFKDTKAGKFLGVGQGDKRRTKRKNKEKANHPLFRYKI